MLYDYLNSTYLRSVDSLGRIVIPDEYIGSLGNMILFEENNDQINLRPVSSIDSNVLAKDKFNRLKISDFLPGQSKVYISRANKIISIYSVGVMKGRRKSKCDIGFGEQLDLFI